MLTIWQRKCRNRFEAISLQKYLPGFKNMYSFDKTNRDTDIIPGNNSPVNINFLALLHFHTCKSGEQAEFNHK